MFSNIGVAGQSPSVYFSSDSNLSDFILNYGGDVGIYPSPPPGSGYEYTSNQDLKWFFSPDATIGQDVTAGISIDRVDVSFFGDLWFGQKIKPFFKTGGVKYYLSEFSPTFWPTESSIFGGGGIGANVQADGYVFYWTVNPATNQPWTKAAVLAGEFGFELTGVTSIKTARIRCAYVQVWWGWNGFFGSTNGTPSTVATSDAPCGQEATLPNAFTNYEAKILDVKPAYGPLAGGTQIEIRGYNFDTSAGGSVMIGGLPATGVVFLDDQHIIATTPAHAVGFADVVVNQASGVPLVFPNGFQYTLFTRGEDIRRTPGVNIQLGLNSGSNTCQFTVDGESNPPKVGEKIQIIDEFSSPRRLLFAGNVQSVEQVYEGLTTQLAWNVSAVDFTWLMNRRRPFGEYHNVSASDIVKDLIRKYAPGFTTNFVQTNLAKVSIALDGSWDLQTCLSVIARMIGGGHWYVDFAQDVHFFHIVPGRTNMPTLAPPATPTDSGAILRVGPASAPTVAQGALFASTPSFSFTPGLYFFQCTFVYENGTESAYGPAVLAALDGQHKIAFTNIPVGSTVSGLTVTKRRIYYTANTIVGGSKRYAFAEIGDNTTTAFTTLASFKPQVGETTNVFPLDTPAPAEALVDSPVYAQPNAKPVPGVPSSTTGILCQPEYRPSGQNTALTWSPGYYRFRVVDIYQDLTESLPGPASDPVQTDGSHLVHLDNIPIGPAVNGVQVIARRILGGFGTDPTLYSPWWVVPNNTALTADISPTTSNRQASTSTGSAPGVEQQEDPTLNVDGPYLENFDLPDEVTDDSPYLLRDPQVTSTVDQSQIRNRIFIRGAGSQTTDTVSSGSRTIPVGDCSYYEKGGGMVFIEGQVRNYTTVSATEGPGNLTLETAIGEPINSGAPVSLYLMVEDKQAQDDLGRVELDFNGQPTDGVHEYVIVDTSLFTVDQMRRRGQAELELFARPITSVTYSTRDPKTRPGAVVTINLQNPPISGEFLIQSVTIDQIHNEADDLMEPRYNVTTSSNKFDLSDLFFQWATKTSNPNTGAGGSTSTPSGTGMPEASSSGGDGNSLGGNTLNPNATNMWTGVNPTTLAKVDQVWTSGFTSAISFLSDSQGFWIRMTGTSTGEGGETTLANIPNAASFRCDQGLRYNITVRFPSSQNASRGIAGYFGLYDGNALSYDGPANGDTRALNNARKFIGARVDARGWYMIVADGTTCQEYGPIHTMALDTIYFVSIRVVSPTQAIGSGFSFYGQNFPGGAIEVSVVTLNETTNAFTGRVALPPVLLTTGLFGWAKLWNAEQPSPNTSKNFDINTANGAVGG